MTDPSPRTFLSARWRDLVMINYRVPEELLAPMVPAGTELDLFEGASYASVVGFLFEDTRLLGIPVPGHRNFEELNLRFYLRRQQVQPLRRAVAFVREVVPRRAIAAVARWVYNEPYIALPMRHRCQQTPSGREIELGWRLGGRWQQMRARCAGEPAELVAGSFEEFIAEHYWGYTAQRDGGTVEYRVDHPPWRVWGGDRVELELDADLAALYGPRLAEALGQPHSCFVAEGSRVTVGRPRRLRLVE